MYSRYCYLRDMKGMKDADVHRITGIAKATFSDWKKGKSVPKQDKLILIAECLGVSLEYLMTGKESNSTFSDENAHLVAKIRADRDLSDALLKYFELSKEKRRHVVELINLLSE